MPPSTPQFSRLSIILAKNILAAPIAPSLPLGFPFSAHNLPPPPLSRKLISPPKISPSHQPRHEAFSEAVAKAKRSAKRLLAAIRKNGANDYEIPFLSQTLVTNTLALGAFFAP